MTKKDGVIFTDGTYHTTASGTVIVGPLELIAKAPSLLAENVELIEALKGCLMRLDGLEDDPVITNARAILAAIDGKE